MIRLEHQVICQGLGGGGGGSKINLEGKDLAIRFRKKELQAK